jgi:hypothetical protein
MSPPASRSKNKASKKPVGKLVESRALLMVATFSSEMLVDLQQTTQHYIPKDRKLQLLFLFLIILL